MTEVNDAHAAYRDFPLGGQLGHLEYLVTPEVLEKFRLSVSYPDARFPNLAAREFQEVLTRKIGNLPLVSVKHVDRYYTPPILHRRVQVTGWLRESLHQEGRDWLVVETFAVDEIGTEIIRSVHTFVVGDQRLEVAAMASDNSDGPAREELPPLVKIPTKEDLAQLEELNCHLAGGGKLATTSKDFLPEEMSFSYLHELADRRFGIDFRQGGCLSVQYLAPVQVGDQLTARGWVQREDQINGRDQFKLYLRLENQRGEITSEGEADVLVPSPLT
ncbi:MAG: hypothetical protein ACE5Q6_13150 [Dehalococcoidia bacterium]